MSSLTATYIVTLETQRALSWFSTKLRMDSKHGTPHLQSHCWLLEKTASIGLLQLDGYASCPTFREVRILNLAFLKIGVPPQIIQYQSLVKQPSVFGVPNWETRSVSGGLPQRCALGNGTVSHVEPLGSCMWIATRNCDNSSSLPAEAKGPWFDWVNGHVESRGVWHVNQNSMLNGLVPTGQSQETSWCMLSVGKINLKNETICTINRAVNAKSRSTAICTSPNIFLEPGGSSQRCSQANFKNNGSETHAPFKQEYLDVQLGL